MNIHVTMSVALALASLPATAIAQVTQTYQYDGNGRLIGVATSGSGGTNTASYAYDGAHNRVQRVRSGTSTYAAVYSLPEGRMLSPSEALVSPDGRFTFAMRPSGRLELWREDEPVWRLEDLAGAPRFATTDAGARLALGRGQAPGTSLWSVTNDGALIATAGTGEATIWSSTAGTN